EGLSSIASPASLRKRRRPISVRRRPELSAVISASLIKRSAWRADTSIEPCATRRSAISSLGVSGTTKPRAMGPPAHSPGILERGRFQQQDTRPKGLWIEPGTSHRLRARSRDTYRIWGSRPGARAVHYLWSNWWKTPENSNGVWAMPLESEEA